MRPGPNNRRMRGRGNGARRSGPSRTQHFDSNGPDLKVRGNAQQIVDKYQALAQEAMTAGNPVMAENYYQHAEHYLRVLGAATENRPDNNRDNNRDNQQNADSQNSERENSGSQGDQNRKAPVAEEKAAETANGNGHQAEAPTDTDDGKTKASTPDNSVVPQENAVDAGSETDTGDTKEASRNPADIAARASRPRRRRPRPAPTEAGDAVS